MSDEAKAVIPEDLRNRHALLKAWTEAGKHPHTEYNTFEFAKEIVALIERIASAEQRATAAEQRVAQLEAEKQRIRKEALDAMARDAEEAGVYDKVVLPDQLSSNALPPLGEGYRADIVSMIPQEQRDKWKRKWAKMDEEGCLPRHYKHYEWQCRLVFEELERRESQLRAFYRKEEA